jgi:hypothetical protein
MEETSSSESLVLIRPTYRHIPEDGIIHNHRRENLRSYINRLDSVAGRSVSPVRCERGSYIPEDGILHSHSRENLKSYLNLAISLHI